MPIQPVVSIMEERQPLDRLILQVNENGKTYQKPALSEHWMHVRQWMQFIPFTRLPQTDSGAKDRWIAAAMELCQDLHWLLSLSHNCFWSQLVFDPGARGALLSYLECAPRSYDRELASLDKAQKKVLSDLHSLVFRVYMRITTQKESDSCFQTHAGLGKLLYDNYLLDVPTMLDLCLLYGHGNTAKSLAKSLNFVLQMQPKFIGDFESAAQMLARALKELEAYFVLQPLGSKASKGPPLSNQAPGSKEEMSARQLEDLVLFLLDLVSSVSTLLQLVPSACTALQNTLIEAEIARFYELVIPELYNKVLSVPDDAQCNDLQKKVDTARYHLLYITKGMLGTKVAAIVETDDNSTAAAMAEEYIAVLSECLAEPHFIRDYHVLSPINQDLEILQQKCPEQLDSGKYAFLIESVYSCFDVPQRSQQQELSKSRPQQSSKPPAQSEPSTSKSNGYAEDNAEALVLESLVSEIQSILPDLGAGFVQQCLKHFKFNKEDVINAILEESLPTELQGLDRTMALPSQSLDGASTSSSIPVRLNVFDHDEFDVMSRDHIDTSRVYRGKKRSKHKNLTQLLEDKEDIKGLRDFYSRYGSVQDVVYDDEYDDTYDEINDISVDDPDPLTERRPFVMPRVLAAQQAAVEDDNVDCEEEEEEENARALPPRDREAFVQDPALLREQAEQRRASKMAQQHRPRPPPKDVVGNSKGQGQDSNVLLNRQRKNTHKSSQGNHNRRAGAQRKMRQGMVPS